MVYKPTARQKKVATFIEYAHRYLIGFVALPGYFLFHIFVIRPYLVAAYELGSFLHCFHVAATMLFFINVTGNMYLVIKKSDKPQESFEKGRFCDFCQSLQSRDSWHCPNHCNRCIEGRDHHCLFLSCCVGLHNHRHFLLYLIYMLISIIYATYNDYYFLSQYDGDFNEMFYVIATVLNPLTRMLYRKPLEVRDICTYGFMCNIGLIIWFIALNYFHIFKAIKGLKTYEYRKGCAGDSSKWKENLLKIFGRRWYVAIVWPFAESDYEHNRLMFK